MTTARLRAKAVNPNMTAAALLLTTKASSAPVSRHNRSAAWHWFAAYYLGAFHNWNCEFDQSVHYLEKAKGMSEAAGRLEGISVARSGIGMGLAWQGRLDEASDEIERALVEAGSVERLEEVLEDERSRAREARQRVEFERRVQDLHVAGRRRELVSVARADDATLTPSVTALVNEVERRRVAQC